MFYFCLKDFYNEDGTLRVLDHNDEVYFGELNYKVWSFTFAVHRSAKNPNKIFKILGLDKWKICRDCYGYSLELKKLDFVFPEFKTHDYEAATRVMLYLMNEWEKQYGVVFISPKMKIRWRWNPLSILKNLRKSI